MHKMLSMLKEVTNCLKMCLYEIVTERCYSGTRKTQPKKNSSGGFGDYCCIPNCKSDFYDSRREKSGISLFQLPSNDYERKKWIKIISKFRRSGPGDNFNSSNENKWIFVCEFHFKTDKIRVTLGVGRKKLLPEAILLWPRAAIRIPQWKLKAFKNLKLKQKKNHFIFWFISILKKNQKIKWFVFVFILSF